MADSVVFSLRGACRAALVAAGVAIVDSGSGEGGATIREHAGAQPPAHGHAAEAQADADSGADAVDAHGAGGDHEVAQILRLCAQLGASAPDDVVAETRVELLNLRARGLSGAAFGRESTYAAALDVVGAVAAPAASRRFVHALFQQPAALEADTGPVPTSTPSRRH